MNHPTNFCQTLPWVVLLIFKGKNKRRGKKKRARNTSLYPRWKGCDERYDATNQDIAIIPREAITTRNGLLSRYSKQWQEEINWISNQSITRFVSHSIVWLVFSLFLFYFVVCFFGCKSFNLNLGQAVIPREKQAAIDQHVFQMILLHVDVSTFKSIQLIRREQKGGGIASLRKERRKKVDMVFLMM